MKKLTIREILKSIMNEKEQYRRVLRFAFCFVLLSIYAFMFKYVWYTYYRPNMEVAFYRKGNWVVIGFYVLWLYAIVKVYGGWKAGYLRLFNLIFAHIMGVFVTNVMIYFTIALLTKHFENSVPLIVLSVCQILLSSVWSKVCTLIYLNAYPPRKVLMIIGEKNTSGLIGKINSRADRFDIAGEININVGLEAIQKEIKKYQGIIIGDIKAEMRNDIVKYAYDIGVRSYIVPKISDLILRGAENQHMFDTPLLMSRNAGFTVERLYSKRIMDVIITIILLIPGLPIMAIVALCIKLDDGGSIFYTQERLTVGGRKFNIMKFRSMRENAENDGVARLATEDDDRITRVGRIIRAYRLDELPQLFNVLKGDMSLVGPRPERPSISDEYEKIIPEFRYRLKVKAGLTGYAQVYGKYNTTAYDKLKLDIMYIQNCTLVLDLEILMKTVLVLFTKEATEGVEKGQEIAL